ncbi:hypothetical protein ACQEUU_37080 [Nonomuraea sp. CA-218870]|uniref:hypothetical protein n=1 Tax=Nonomuraea sp. CA-218870 TaxID=3239998 RepID=UPI003D8A6A3F
MAGSKITPDRDRDASHLLQQTLVANDRAVERSRRDKQPTGLELRTLTVGAAYDADAAEQDAARRFVQRTAAELGDDAIAELLDILGLGA